MTKPEIIGYARSTYTRVVRMVCEEKGIDHAMTEVPIGAPELRTIHPFGKMPEGGEPTTLTPFPEMKLGWEADGKVECSLLDLPEWQYVAEIDPELARRTAAFVDHCVNERKPERVLSPGARELIGIAALCARGEVDIAASAIRRAYAYGFSRRQVLEAISCVLPMTGALTVQIGVRAMQAAESE